MDKFILLSLVSVLVVLVVLLPSASLASQSTWSQFTYGTPPSARVFAASAGNAPIPPPFAPSQKTGVVFFGGASAIEYTTVYNDVWILNVQDTESDGRAWTQINTTGTAPAARCLSAIAVAESSDTLYMFGGFDGTNWYNDLWSLDLSVIHFPGTSVKWQLQDNGHNGGPSIRCGMSMVWWGGVDIDENLMIFGGGVNKRELYSDAWAYDTSGSGEGWSGPWTATQGYAWPPAREFHGASISNKGQLGVWIFGGYDYGYNYYNDTWHFSNTPTSDSWRQDVPSKGQLVPAARSNFGTATFTDNNSTLLIMIFGGRAGDGSVLFSDTWIYNDSEEHWEEVEVYGTTPGKLYGVSAGPYIPESTSESPGMVLFGGADVNGDVYGEVWVLQYNN